MRVSRGRPLFRRCGRWAAARSSGPADAAPGASGGLLGAMMPAAHGAPAANSGCIILHPSTEPAGQRRSKIDPAARRHGSVSGCGDTAGNSPSARRREVSGARKYRRLDETWLMDFLIIFKFGSAVARFGGERAAGMLKPLALCRDVARRKDVPATDLLAAQVLAGRWWSNLGLTLIVPTFLVVIVGAIVRPGHLGREIGAYIIFLFVAMAACAFGQVPVQIYRMWRTRRGIRAMGSQAQRRPLPPDSGGLPRRRDFWIAAALPLIAFGVALYVALRERGGL